MVTMDCQEEKSVIYQKTFEAAFNALNAELALTRNMVFLYYVRDVFTTIQRAGLLIQKPNTKTILLRMISTRHTIGK